MKLKEGIVGKLKLARETHMTMRAPFAPCMITGLSLSESGLGQHDMADAELGWSGLQTLCCSKEAIDILQANNCSPYAMEGVGYVSLSEKLFDDFDASKVDDLSKEDRLSITGLITAIVSSTFHPQPDPREIIVVQLQKTDSKFPAGITGFQCHIIVPVEQGIWMGMYQIHAQELQVATKVFEELNKVMSAKDEIENALSTDRVLN